LCGTQQWVVRGAGHEWRYSRLNRNLERKFRTLKIAGCGTQELEVGDCLQLKETTQE
jgi:hypothetical protein